MWHVLCHTTEHVRSAVCRVSKSVEEKENGAGILMAVDDSVLLVDDHGRAAAAGHECEEKQMEECAREAHGELSEMTQNVSRGS